DGDKDITYGPTDNGFENYKVIGFYENTRTDANPDFVYRTDTLFMNEMIDVGSYASPYFYDFNKDGKQDMFVASGGYYQQNGTFRSKVSYYENISQGKAIKFEFITDNFLQIDTLNIFGASLAVGDMDGDGKDELIVGTAE